MRLFGRDRDSAAGVVLLFILMASILVSYYVADRVRREIEADALAVHEFLGTWYALKADLALFAAANGGENRKDALLDRLSLCDRRLAGIVNSKATRAMRSMRMPMAVAAEELSAAWLSLRTASARLIRETGKSDRASGLFDSVVLRASLFESSAASWIDTIEKSLRAVRASIAILLFFLLIAAIGLAALSAWFAVSASRARKMEEVLRDLMRATYRAQETERKRISLDLHDTLAQELAAALMHASCIAEDEKGHRKALQEAIRRAIGQVRDISWNMRPPELEKAGLSEAVSEYCRRFEEQSGVAVDYRGPDLPFPPLADETATNLFRILQEALTNVHKYSGAARVAVTLRNESSLLVLRVEDFGTGFIPETLAASASHQGIAGMKERGRIIGGALSVLSAPGRGTTVVAEVPLE